MGETDQFSSKVLPRRWGARGQRKQQLQKPLGRKPCGIAHPLPARGPDPSQHHLGSVGPERGVPGGDGGGLTALVGGVTLLPSHFGNGATSLALGGLRSIPCKPEIGMQKLHRRHPARAQAQPTPCVLSPSLGHVFFHPHVPSFSNHLPRACCVLGTKSSAKASSFLIHVGAPLATKTGGSQGCLVWISSSLSFGFCSGLCPPALISWHHARD